MSEPEKRKSPNEESNGLLFSRPKSRQERIPNGARESENKKNDRFIPKDSWHLYSLQALPSGKFIRVVGNILNGRFLLISPRSNRTEFAAPLESDIGCRL